MIKINDRFLRDIGVTQNEVGRYYWNGKSYYKPKLQDFDKFTNSTLPSGYKVYTNGSHSYTNWNGVNIRVQNAIDFSIANGVVTFMTDVVIYAKTSTAVFAQLVGKPDRYCLEHMKDLPALNKVIKAGNKVCVTTDHAHAYKLGGLIRNDVLFPMVKKGRAEIIKDEWLRSKAGYDTTIIRVPKGTVGLVTSNPIFYGSHYWQYIEVLGKAGWINTDVLKETDKYVTVPNPETPPTIVEPPVIIPEVPPTDIATPEPVPPAEDPLEPPTEQVTLLRRIVELLEKLLSIFKI